MNIQLAQRIGWRYFRSSRDFLRSVASIAMLGFAFSIAILVVTQAVVSGFESELRDRVLGLLPHVTIQSRSDTMDLDELEAQLNRLDLPYRGSPIIESSVLIAAPASATAGGESQSNRSQVEAARLTGIEPGKYVRASHLAQYVSTEAINQLTPGSFAILLGRDKARKLGVTTGDFVTVVMMEATVTPIGVIPRQKRFRVTGIVDTHTFLDAVTAYIHIADAARLNRIYDGVSSYKLQVDDPFKTLDVVDSIRSLDERNSYVVSDWVYRYGFLGERIIASRNMLLLIFSLVVAIAAFNLVSTIVVFVNQRQQDVAVLRTFGASRILIGVSFLITGIMLSLLGLLLGGLLGVMIGYGLELVVPLISDFLGDNVLQEYFVHKLKVKFAISDLVLVGVVGLGLTVLAAIYPAWRAMRMEPAEILRRD